MRKEALDLLNGVNRAIIQFRGIYSAWSGKHGKSYHEMLVYYTIREYGYCTQKQICDNYLLPKQTIHNVIQAMRKCGILEEREGGKRGREKVFALTERGQAEEASFLRAMGDAESKALKKMGEEKLRRLTELLWEYDGALHEAFGRETRAYGRQDGKLGNGENK